MKKTKPKPDIIYNELNESDSALDAFCMSHGTRITIIDEQIANLPDDNVNKAHLQQIRAGVERAHLARNGELLESRFETLTIGLKAAVHAIPLAVASQKGIKKIKEGNLYIKGGEKTHANKESRKNAIRPAVNNILNDPLKARWNKDPIKIARHLVKNGMGGTTQIRTLRTYIEEIMAEHAHSEPTI